ncbi:MAG: hypothetical protein KJ601_01965 [Nanoarchaeota archaeon]|nr:hypothetical protein [Nanoarchaeota archaeon]MBU1704752.1 hypothetical protein [Nanoarchaeota archaeon]
MNKHGVVDLAIIVLVVVCLVFLGWLVNLGTRECSGNNDCSNAQYCGADFSCHDIPIIEKEVKTTQVSLVGPAFILGIAAVVVAVILRWDKISAGFKKKGGKKPEVYYEGVDQIKTNF